MQKLANVNSLQPQVFGVLAFSKNDVKYTICVHGIVVGIEALKSIEKWF